jgi:hypothetical protein
VFKSGGLSAADQTVCQKAQDFIDEGGGTDAANALIGAGNGANDNLGEDASTFGSFGLDGYSYLDLSSIFFDRTPIHPPIPVVNAPAGPISIPSNVQDAADSIRMSCALKS